MARGPQSLATLDFAAPDFSSVLLPSFAPGWVLTIILTITGRLLRFWAG
jgi:hypothetical protein